MAKQGFNYQSNNPYVYQECDAGKSAALGLDNANALWKLKVSAAPGAVITSTAHFTIDPAANGNITLTPNGNGNVVLSSLGVGVVLASSTGVLSSTVGLAGQVLKSNGPALAPSFQAEADFAWHEVLGVTQALSVQNAYVLNNVALVTATLPATAVLGDTIIIMGKGLGGWKIAQNAGQTIHIEGSDTTPGAGGYIASTNRYDSVELVCITANTDFVIRNSTGNLTIV